MQKPIFLSDSGATVSTTVDLRFAQMLLNGGKLDAAGVRILSRKTVELMNSDLLSDLSVAGGPMLPG